jgi:peptidoglycan hydrolase CwlO-like protein
MIMETNNRIDETNNRIDGTNRRIDRLYEVIVRREEHEGLKERLARVERAIKALEERIVA